MNAFKQGSINSVCIPVNRQYAVKCSKNFFSSFEFEAGDIEKAKCNLTIA